MAWRYVTTKPVSLYAPELEAVYFENAWVTIKEGDVVISEGYAWDGCSPSIKIPFGKILPNGIWLGTWDGPLGTNGRPVTLRASLTHDVLCQFRKQIYGIRKMDTVQLFARHLKEDAAPEWICKLYPKAVLWYGPQDWHGDHDYADELLQRLKSYDHNQKETNDV